MMTFSDYIHAEKISEALNSATYAGNAKNSGQRVTITVLKAHKASPSEKARFKKECRHIMQLAIDGFARIVDVFEQDDELVLVTEYMEYPNLKFRLSEMGRMDIETFLVIGEYLAGIFGRLHSEEGIHMAVCPSHIHPSPDFKTAVISGYGISDIITQDSKDHYNPVVITGISPYLSPEQTGRMNRSVDYRSDLYSLGICFYEMLTGKPPFQSSDPMAIIHSHIALEPERPGAIVPDIPEPVSDIILKLLEKNPENRYQNGFGLMADLRKCRDLLSKKGEIQPFTLAENDISQHFIIPQVVFGRVNEVRQLLSAFDDMMNSCRRVSLMAVSGAPGIGKSTVIGEIRKPIIANRGYFLSGKYEQFRNDKPYNGIIQSFQTMIRQLLVESPDMIGRWKRRLLSRLGRNAKVITDIIPELTLIIGPPAEIAELGTEESSNRFLYVFEQFIHALCTREQPLVFFLDDMQWVDQASCKLLRNLVSSPDLNNLFLIFSYRDNEVDNSHPLMDFFKHAGKSGLTVNSIRLSPLSEMDISDLIRNFMKSTEEKARALAGHLYQKTGGNPFFVNQFLHTLYSNKLLSIDPVNGWVWDDSIISRMQITDNLVDLMADKISRFSGETQDILKICSCIGNRFDVETIAMIMGQSVENVLTGLDEPVRQGLISPNQKMYMFHHDRIQEAAYSLITDDEKSKLHYHIGSITMKNCTGDELPNRLFYIADHFELGLPCVTRHEESIAIARYFLAAGMKAKSSAAYGPALRYLNTGIGLLDEGFWKTQYELSKNLVAEGAEAAYLNGDYDQMDIWAEQFLIKTATAVERLPVILSMVFSYSARENYDRAIDIILPVLKELGICIPRKPGNMTVLKELLLTRLAFRGMSTDDLLNLPQMENENLLAAVRMMVAIFLPAMFTDHKLFAVLILKGVRLSKKYGNSTAHGFLYNAYGLILSGVFFDFRSSVAFGELGLNLMKKMNTKTLETETLLIYHGMIKSWTSPFRDAIPSIIDTARKALETGNHLVHTTCYLLRDTQMFFSGYEINQLINVHEESRFLMAHLNQYQNLTIHSIARQHTLNMIGDCENPLEIRGKAVDAETLISEWIQKKNYSAMSIYYFAKLALAVQFNDFGNAVRYSDQYMLNIHAQQGLINTLYAFTFDSLARLMNYEHVSFKEKCRYRAKLLCSLFRLQKWSESSMENALQHYELVRAVIAWKLKGNMIETVTKIDAAVRLSQKHGDKLIEHMSHVMAIDFYCSIGNRAKAGDHMRELLVLLTVWGAKGVINHMMDKYPDLVPENMTNGNSGEMISLPENQASTGTDLDFNAINKVCLALSGEIDLKRLLEYILGISMEYAGAQRGFLILENKNDHKHYIEVSGSYGNCVHVQSLVPIYESMELSAAIVNFVVKTGENLLLNDVCDDERFVTDPYIRQLKPKSLLCYPIRHKGKIAGILYLENNLVTGAFTPDRLKLLRMLSAQAAISIENAQLFQDIKHAETQLRKFNLDLEELVEERTTELKLAYEQILSSIRYSSIIQNSMLPDKKLIEEYLPESFIIWRPKSIVGGDIYVFEKTENGIIIAVVDCTGHGVPGAFMTMLAGSGMRRVIKEERVLQPGDILKRMNHFIKTSLQQDTEHARSDDGLDAAICYYDHKEKSMSFSGARLPLYIIEKGLITVIKGDKKSVGYIHADLSHDFQTHRIENITPDMRFYLATDGFHDQLGGPENRRFGSRPFKNLLVDHHTLSFDQQKESLVMALEQHQANSDRTDDVTVIGFRCLP